jgi:GNAT superfamily N-acetyltransferase
MRIRPAMLDDLSVLTALIDRSVRVLQAGDYSTEQIDRALRTVYGIDTQLIHDATYFAVEEADEIVACGGWSKRRTLYGGDQAQRRDDSLLDPAREAARIRAFFVDPSWTRRGIGSLILDCCEQAARAEGFLTLELGSTLTGIPFYAARGYSAAEQIDVPLGDFLSMPVVRMVKRIDAR